MLVKGRLSVFENYTVLLDKLDCMFVPVQRIL